eukprot:g46343.t1
MALARGYLFRDILAEYLSEQMTQVMVVCCILRNLAILWGTVIDPMNRRECRRSRRKDREMRGAPAQARMLFILEVVLHHMDFDPPP